MAENSKKTRLRFKGFTEAWEQCKLGQIGSVAMCKRVFKEQTQEEGDIPFYKIGTFGGQADGGKGQTDESVHSLAARGYF